LTGGHASAAVASKLAPDTVVVIEVPRASVVVEKLVITGR
jgi:hypothetical protein